MSKAKEMPDGWRMKKVGDPLRPGQSKLVIERELKCACGGCRNSVVLHSEVELEDRDVPYEEVPQIEWRGGQPFPTGKILKVFPFTSPKKSPEEITLGIPDDWRCVTVLPTNRWPGDFIKAVKEGADFQTAVALYKNLNDRWARWYCSLRCRFLGELRIEAERAGMSKVQLKVLECIIKVAFFFTKFRK